MKKQLFLILAIGIVNGVFADNAPCNEQEGDAFVIQFTGDASECDWLSEKGIPHTHKINGRYFSSWIQYPRGTREDDEVMKNVSVTEQKEDGSFGDSRKLDTYSRFILANCYDVIEPYKSFAESDKDRWKVYSWKKYDADHLHFVEQLKSNNCFVCKHGPEKTIIMNPQGLPEDVCKSFKAKRKEEMDKRAGVNARMTSRAYAQMKKKSQQK